MTQVSYSTESSDLLERGMHHWACSVQHLWRRGVRGKNLEILNAEKLYTLQHNLEWQLPFVITSKFSRSYQVGHCSYHKHFSYTTKIKFSYYVLKYTLKNIKHILQVSTEEMQEAKLSKTCIPRGSKLKNKRHIRFCTLSRSYYPSPSSLFFHLFLRNNFF